MHHDILLLVYASDRDGAVNLAEMNLERVIENDTTFDYGSVSIADEENGPVKASSKEGQERISVAITRTNAHFLRTVRWISEALDLFADSELWEKKNSDNRDISANETALLESFRYNCLRIGRSSGRYTDIYDPVAHGIRSPVHLKNVLGGWGDQARADDLWVFVADVHC